MKTFIGFLHFILICAVLFSPILFPYQLILVGIALYYIQLGLLGGCYLTKTQFGSYDDTFYYHVLLFFGIPVSKAKVKFFADKVLPACILILALIIQLVLKFNPLLNKI